MDDIDLMEIEDPRQAVYPDDHPMRLRNGMMPHMLTEDEFARYLKFDGMTERAYWVSVGLGEDFCLRKQVKTVPTGKLTPDQKGWAKHYYPGHFAKKGQKWIIRESKPSHPHPAFDVEFHPYRDRPRAFNRGTFVLKEI